MTTQAQPGLPADNRVLKTLTASRGMCIGVYADVVTPGTLALGSEGESSGEPPYHRGADRLLLALAVTAIPHRLRAAGRQTGVLGARRQGGLRARRRRRRWPSRAGRPRPDTTGTSSAAAWADTDRNGCDTRDDILKRDLTDVKFSDGDCKVTSGTLEPDPYTGKDVTFVRGGTQRRSTSTTSSRCRTPGRRARSSWDAEQADQPSPTTRSTCSPSTPAANRSKGDGDTATWLPPQQGVPVHVRGPAGRGEEEVRAVGHRRREGRHEEGAVGLPRAEAAHRGHLDTRRPERFHAG